MKELTTYGYWITTDPHFLDQEYGITRELSKKFLYYHSMALDGKKSDLPKFLKIIEQYPNIPHFKNYLSTFYANINDQKKAFETNHWIIAEHPDYLFGKLNLASEYYLNEKYNKIPEILGEMMEIKALYPNRDTFHVNEVLTFNKVAVMYFAAIKDWEQAEIRMSIMKEIAPDSKETEFASTHLMQKLMISGMSRFLDEQKNKIMVNTGPQKRNNKKKSPLFENKEIEYLYKYNFSIENEKLESILYLPRESLIRDLKLVLQDSIDRYNYFSKLIDSKDAEADSTEFLLHAIFMLGQLEASESLDSIFDVLSQSDDYYELYMGDFLTELIWEPIYKIANKHLAECLEFAKKPGLNTFARLVVLDVVEQTLYHQPHRRQECLEWMRDLMKFMLQSKIDDNVIDSDFNGYLVWDLINMDFRELLPEISQMFEAKLVSETICGTLEKVRIAFEEKSKFDDKKEILSIVDRYKEINNGWYSGSDNDIQESVEHDYYKNDYQEILPVRSEPKIGRNEPCPCGSGKKYKKCCLK